MRPIGIAVGACVALVWLSVPAARAQDWPTRPIKIVTPLAAGGAADAIGHAVGDAFTAATKLPMVIDNRPGGGGTLAAVTVARAEPDGTTLLLGTAAALNVAPVLAKNFPADLVAGLTPLTLAVELPMCLVVNKSLPINSVPDLIAYLKARPGAVNFGSSGRATSDLLAAARFMLQTGTKMVDVPYAGGGQALSDMMAGSTQVMFPQLPAVLGLINSGQVRALAVTSARRLSQLPDVPTLSESGLPGFHVTSWNELFGPRGLPDDVRDLLSRTLVDAIRNDHEIREKMLALGVEPVGEGSARAEAFFDEELTRWKDVIDRAGIKLEQP